MKDFLQFAACSCLYFSLISPAISSTLNFTGTLEVVYIDAGTGTYSGTATGSTFSGSIAYGDTVLEASSIDINNPISADYFFIGSPYGGFLSDGTVTISTLGATSTIGIGDNDGMGDDAAILNDIYGPGSTTYTDIADVWFADSFNSTYNFGVTLYSLDTSLYSGLGFQSVPPVIGATDFEIFYIEEFDALGNTIYLATGIVNSASAVSGKIISPDDYLVVGNSGDSWSYTTFATTDGMPPGTDFTVTAPWYVGFPLPDEVPTDVVLPFEPGTNLILEFIDSLTVPAGTFNNVLRASWLDPAFPANSVNTDFGIDPLIDQGVTDVEWYAYGVGIIKFLGVMADSGAIDGGYELNAFALSYLAPGWTASDFHILCQPPLSCTGTRTIEFDASDNLYIEDTADDGSAQVQILKLDASSGYSTSSIFTSYSSVYAGVTGLDFDDSGNLYVSEFLAGGEAGIIRKVDVASQMLSGDVMAFANHRPTGVDADTTGNVYYSGRKSSSGTWGKLYQIDSSLIRTELSVSTVATGIALDKSGNIFISTPTRTDLPLLSKSVYMFEADDVDLLYPIRIATFHDGGGELTFDDNGNLYMIAQDGVSIVKLSPDDTDGDGVADYDDNCILVANANQADKDGNGLGDACEPPQLTGIWSSGDVVVGETISLFVFGDYFDAAPGATQVFVNGYQQFIVQVVTPEMLIVRVTVTADMIGGPVTVSTSNGSADSSTNFGIPAIGLQLTGVWPGTVTEGVTTSVFVFGSGFDLTAGATEVYFNGVRQWIVQVVTTEMLIVRITPTAALSGPVSVTTPAGTAVSSSNLLVVP